MTQQRDNHSYNLDALYELLVAAFTEEELRRFCHDRATFRPVVRKFGRKYNLHDVVLEVIWYCEESDLLDELLAAVQEQNPRQYARFEHALHDPSYIPPDCPPVPPRPSKDPEVERAQRNRQAMLQLVWNTWIKGVLEQSLHGAAMIELGMEERADAVERPWDMLVQMPEQPPRELPHGTKIIDVFDGMNQSLLILGEPGSGKTTMLLDLARDAIKQAQRCQGEPIPVVLNLSSFTVKTRPAERLLFKRRSDDEWAEKNGPVAEWLVDELSSKYHVPEKVARPWVENDQLLLLLDGLDELKSDARAGCVEALNQFRASHLVPMVVCSRVADYQVLTQRLNLCGAVLLQPLTLEQVEQYLTGMGPGGVALLTGLERDSALEELAQTPVMLNIMTLAYPGIRAGDLHSGSSIEAMRWRLFSAYVRRMFTRRNAKQPYGPEETIHWLSWLARRMIEHTQTVFLIESVQPDWQDTLRQRRVYGVRVVLSAMLVSGLVSGLGFGLVLWPFSELVSTYGPWQFLVPFVGLGNAVLASIIGTGYFEASKIKLGHNEAGTIEIIRPFGWSWRGVLEAIPFK